MEEQNLKDLITKFKESETVKALDSYFSEKSMMEILGVDRDENAHSNFLAWLFENEITGKEACRLLIKLLNKKYDALTDKDGLNTIDIEDLTINTIKVIREEFVSDWYHKSEDKIEHADNSKGTEITGRSDILIVINEGEDNAACIMIENKIDSEEICEWASIKNTPKDKLNKDDKKSLEENEDKKSAFENNSLWQTQFYYKYYSEQKDLKNMVFAFLTRPDREAPKCEHFFHITYQDIMDGILVPIMRNISDCSALLNIKDYMKTLGKSYTQEDVMAICPSMQELVTKMYDENKELFDCLFDCKEVYKMEEREFLINFWNSNVLNTPVRDILRPVIELLSPKEAFRAENGKDDTRYKLEEYEFKKNPFFKQLVIKYIEAYKNKHANEKKISLEHLQRTFPPSLHIKKTSSRTNYLTNNHIIREDFKMENNHWKKVEGYYICQTGWDGPAMMSRLISYVKTLKEFENIEILEIPLFLQK